MNSEIKVRWTLESDIPQIESISNAADSAAHWTRQQWTDVFRAEVPPRFAWIAEKEELAIGFLIAQGTAPDWELENIAVLSEFRRQGVGSALLSALISQARLLQAERILLEVRASNLSAIRFYNISDFELLARRRDYYRNPTEDALILAYTFRN